MTGDELFDPETGEPALRAIAPNPWQEVMDDLILAYVVADWAKKLSDTP